MAAGAPVSQAPAGPPVIVNVYTLMSKDSAGTRVSNDVLDAIGMSIYHAGVEILGDEWAFGMDPSQRPDPNIDGIFKCPPRKAVGDFKEAVTVGYMPVGFGPRELQQVLAGLVPHWKAVTYHILDRNCCHFARAFVEALNPDFKKKFPAYVSRAASVGSTVVPEALVNKITAMVAPPPAIPPNLVNIVDVPFRGAVPPAWTSSSAHSPTAPKASPTSSGGGGGAGLFRSAGVALMAAGKFMGSAVGGVVDVIATENDRRTFAAKFPQANAANLKRGYNVSINYCFREHEAAVYVCTDGLYFTGAPSLSLIVPFADIESIAPATFVEPPAPRLPPVFELANPSFAKRVNAFFIYRKSRPQQVTPIFRVRSMASGVTDKLGDTTLTYDAMDFIAAVWRSARSSS